MPDRTVYDHDSGTRRRLIEVRAGEYAPEVAVAVGGADTTLVTMPVAAFMNTPAGGHKLFAATTGFLELSGTGVNEVGLFQNPAGSAVVAYIEAIGFSADTSVGFQSFRINETASATVNGGATPRPAANRAGKPVTSPARLYAAGSYTRTAGVSGRVLIVNTTTDRENYTGEIAVQPGQYLAWSVQAVGANPKTAYKAGVDLSWWLEPAGS